MLKIFAKIPDQFVTPIISAISIIIGSLLGGICSWFITKNATNKNIKVQQEMANAARNHEISQQEEKKKEYGRIIRLDICTALFQSIRGLQNFKKEQEGEVYPIPIDKGYAQSVAALSKEFTLREMSYIYQLYGIIEKMNDILSHTFYERSKSDIDISAVYILYLKKIYGENYKEILQIDVEEVTYTQLYNTPFIKEGYKKVLQKLDEVCDI